VTINAVRVFAPAKINLFLHVGEKRSDSFHDLQSLVVFAGVGDDLSFSAADELSLSLDGPFAAALTHDPDNLVLRAGRALAHKASVPANAKITLSKNLPVASGIGGGSADAAAALRGLSLLWDLQISSNELLEIAATIGSDVPVCVSSTPAWMEGRGEHVTQIRQLPEVAMVLVNPGVAVSTAQVFSGLRTRRGVDMVKPLSFSSWSVLLDFLTQTSNDLEAPAGEAQPVIREVLDALRKVPGALLSRMSGSGATCFALFDSDADAKLAERRLATDHPAWWVRATMIGAQ
jgi:4-diphosphocytidyl-2-C-methyl-D-erythritol kinase